jgi:hypothetical protein
LGGKEENKIKNKTRTTNTHDDGRLERPRTQAEL